MEILVRKASLSLFLEEQRSLYEKRILDQVEGNRELKDSLAKVTDIDEKMEALGEEIKSDPNVDLLEEVIQSSQARAAKSRVEYSEYPSFARMILLITREMMQVMRRILVG